MRIKWLTRKAEWPEEINGYRARPREGNCPECGVDENKWCAEDCTRLDPMDYR